MKNQRTALTLIRLFRPLLHAMVILVVFYAMVKLRQTTDLIPFVQLRIPQIDIYETMLFALVASGIFVFLGLISGLYELFKPLHAYYRKFLRVRGLRLALMSFIAYIGFGYFFVNGISRFVLLMGAVSTWGILTIIDMAINIFNSHQEQKHPYRVLLCSSDTKTAKKVEHTLHLYPMYRIDKIPLSRFSTAKMLPYDIIMITGTADKHMLQTIADEANIHSKLFYHVGDTLFLEDLIAKPKRIGPLIALQYSASPLDGRRKVVKRGIDILGAGLGLIFLSPILLLIALAIKVDSPGPIFYIQKRIGKNKNTFSFIKFRTMFTHLSVGEKYGGNKAKKIYQDLKKSKKNVRKGVLAKIEDDPRVTFVGKLLRKTSLDELASLRNVLIGDMSLVGPRPHMPDEVNRYDKWQDRLFSVKPGVTGYAQIFGRDKLSFDEEARLDLYYIQNRSLFLDIYVLVSTVKVVFSGK